MQHTEIIVQVVAVDGGGYGRVRGANVLESKLVRQPAGRNRKNTHNGSASHRVLAVSTSTYIARFESEGTHLCSVQHGDEAFVCRRYDETTAEQDGLSHRYGSFHDPVALESVLDLLDGRQGAARNRCVECGEKSRLVGGARGLLEGSKRKRSLVGGQPSRTVVGATRLNMR